MSKKINLALFISGGATTATAIIKACFSHKLEIDPVLVIASNKEIAGIERVQSAGFDKRKIVVVDPKICRDQDEFADKLLLVCQKNKVDLIGQYGWLPLTPKKFVLAYQRRIINQHPGPLDPPRPDFGGKGMWGRRVHCAVLYFRRITKHDFWTEATTHFVTTEFDRGEMVNRRRIEILPDDIVEDLQNRILPIEHEVQIEALQDFVSKKVKIMERNQPLIAENENNILAEAKKIAAILYPYG